MPFETEAGAMYKGKLPHFRAPGKVYHLRFSVHPAIGKLRHDWMFEVVENSILFTHKKTNLVFAYVIMPNHIHVVLQPIPKVRQWSAWCDYRQFYRLEDITRRLKTFTAREVNRRLGRSGSFWRDEYYDRIVRNQKDLSALVEYVHNNPVRWKLVESAAQYRWSSVNTIYSGEDRFGGWFDLPQADGIWEGPVWRPART